MSEIQRDEFQQWMETLQRDIRGVHERLDGLNGRTRTIESKVAVLEDRGVRTKDPAARWGAIMAFASGVAVEAFKYLSGNPK